jgi:hypothetical protein
MAYSSIVKPSDYFNTKLYTGNGVGGTNITGVGFQPDLVWIKRRSGVENHVWNDAVRGVPKNIYSSSTNAQDSGSLMSAILSDGFTVQTDASVNSNNDTYASWNWKCETGVSGTTTGSGSSRSYSGRVNTTAGISIINYAGNSTSGHTIPHHLGATPKIIILKNMGDVGDWIVHVGALNDPEKVLSLNTTAAGTNFNAGFNTTTPTSSVFTLGNSVAVNDDNQQYIAYSFAEKKGYSKFGKYTGNGNADGPFIYTGFKPAFVILKKTSGADNWTINDNKRVGYNVDNNELFPNLTNAEDTNDVLELVSNGFKLIHTAGRHNTSGGTYIYMAFAEEPLVANSGTDGVPATAR